MSGGKVVALKRDWRRMLTLDKENKPKAETGNAFLMLTNEPWKECLAYDEFAARVYWAKAPPSLEGFDSPVVGESISDNDLLYAQHWFSRCGQASDEGYGTVLYKSEQLGDAMRAAAHRNKHHPLRDYLRSVVWDKEPRLAKWCHECLGSSDDAYHSAVGRWWMISAVARALEPGCQADHMLILQGPQGLRKSTALRILAGEWYLPELPDVRGKDAPHSLHGRWIVECGELSTMLRQGITQNAIKDFITRMVDVYREPYGRLFVSRKRSVVFAGTTNDELPFSDPTGARRYWPVTCGAIDVKKLRAWRDQLWAEAVAQFDLGEQWHPTQDMLTTLTEAQEERYADDSWESLVLEWASKQMMAFPLSSVMGSLTLTPDKWTKAAETRVGAILQRAGYTSSRLRYDGRRVRFYARPGSLMPEPTEDEPPDPS